MTPGAATAPWGERFRVIYRISGGEAEALATARDICLEQTVEFPGGLIPAGAVRETIVGRVEALEQRSGSSWEAAISYAVATTGGELTQLLNVVFGNYSLHPGVRVERLELPDSLGAAFPGPRFGRAGLRARLGVPRGPLLCTALKPMGLSATVLADLAYQLALGGIDLIKDDHGLANQPFSPFAERVQRCVDAVERANRATGRHCVYVPHVTADGDEVGRRARLAREAGAGGMLVCPGLTGFGTMARLAGDPAVGLPILSHPAFQGSFVASPASGIAHFALFGQIARLAGADGSIFPSYAGRFSFSRDECQAIVSGTAAPMGPIRPCFPVPGGGMRLERVPELLEFYGSEVIFLIGGGLHAPGPDIAENGRTFRRLVDGLAMTSLVACQDMQA